MADLVFLKLGGSAITVKTRAETAREDVIRRIARQVRNARASDTSLRILLGHGSGSFGHFVARRSGFGQPGNWRAYAETAAAAARLDRLVADVFLAEGVPVVSLQPSASARCRDGQLVDLKTEPARIALEQGLVPLVYGDVALDETRQMTIISTEAIFAFLAPVFKPRRILLASVVEGVLTADPQQDPNAQLIREITPASFPQIEPHLRGSHAVDVTGGMASKVKSMLALVARDPSLTVRVMSAFTEGLIEEGLSQREVFAGTLIHSGS